VVDSAWRPMLSGTRKSRSRGSFAPIECVCRVQCFTDRYDANIEVKNFFRNNQNSKNSFAARGNNLISM
jgi:hypothetical protein